MSGSSNPDRLARYASSGTPSRLSHARTRARAMSWGAFPLISSGSMPSTACLEPSGSPLRYRRRSCPARVLQPDVRLVADESDLGPIGECLRILGLNGEGRIEAFLSRLIFSKG